MVPRARLLSATICFHLCGSRIDFLKLIIQCWDSGSQLVIHAVDLLRQDGNVELFSCASLHTTICAQSINISISFSLYHPALLPNRACVSTGSTHILTRGNGLRGVRGREGKSLDWLTATFFAYTRPSTPPHPPAQDTPWRKRQHHNDRERKRQCPRARAGLTLEVGPGGCGGRGVHNVGHLLLKMKLWTSTFMACKIPGSGVTSSNLHFHRKTEIPYIDLCMWHTAKRVWRKLW